MRITQAEHREAVAELRRRFGEAARIWLFGSRADDSRRGGDVDLFVEAAEIPREVELNAELKARAAIEDVFGGLSVDLVVRYPGHAEKPIHRIARRSGIPL